MFFLNEQPGRRFALFARDDPGSFNEKTRRTSNSNFNGEWEVHGEVAISITGRTLVAHC
jgi:hypothetical protein